MSSLPQERCPALVAVANEVASKDFGSSIVYTKHERRHCRAFVVLSVVTVSMVGNMHDLIRSVVTVWQWLEFTPMAEYSGFLYQF